MTEHTPGPWIAFHVHPNPTVCINGLDGGFIGEVFEMDRQGRRGVNDVVKANARLIAAAPELLEALKLALDEIHYPGALRHMGIDLEKAINRVIAKAEGK
jgi:hypothetical protein